MPVQLPFLIVHGETIYTVAAVAVAVFSVWNLWRHRLRVARERTQSSLEELGPITSSDKFAAGSQAVVKGVLQFPKETELIGVLVPFYVDPPAVMTELGSGVTLTGATPLPCEGKAEVLWGADLSREPDKLSARIHPGDEVHIQGTLQALPSSSDQSASYREASVEWRLLGSDETPLRIASCQAPRPGVGVWGAIFAVIVSLACFALGAQIIGAISMKEAMDAKITMAEGELDYPVSLQVGAAMPFHRDDALRYLSYDLKEGQLGTAGARGAVQVELLSGDCPGAALSALEANLWEDAKKLVSTCAPSDSARHAAYQVNWVRADFEEASRLTEQAAIIGYHNPSEGYQDFALSWKSAANIHLLAGNYKAAARVLETEAKAWSEASPDPTPEGWPKQGDLDRVAQELRCLATAARHYAGESVKVPEASTTVCRILQTEQLDPPERVTRLSKLSEDENLRYSRHRELIEFLSIEAGSLTIDLENLMFHRKPSIVHISDIASLEYISYVPDYLGLLVSAFASLSKKDDAGLSRAAYGLEIAYWRALLGQEKLAGKMLLEAREDLLLGSSEEVRVFSRELMASAVPREAKHERSLSELSDLNDLYGPLERLSVIELGLAGLASRRGDSASAQRHVDLAMAYIGPDEHKAYFGEGGYARVPDILRGAPEELPYSIGYGCRDAAECTPDMMRVSSHLYSSPDYPNQALGEIVQRKGAIDRLDAPEWKAETQACVDKWLAAAFDRNRSLLLALLNDL